MQFLPRALGLTEAAEKIVEGGGGGGLSRRSENVVVGWEFGGGGGSEAGDAVENVVVVVDRKVDGLGPENRVEIGGGGFGGTGRRLRT